MTSRERGDQYCYPEVNNVDSPPECPVEKDPDLDDTLIIPTSFSTRFQVLDDSIKINLVDNRRSLEKVMKSKKNSESQTKAGNQEFCKTCETCKTCTLSTFVFMSMLKSHSHTLSLSLFLTPTLFQSLINSLSTC